jgi:hypothetical protein
MRLISIKCTSRFTIIFHEGGCSGSRVVLGKNRHAASNVMAYRTLKGSSSKTKLTNMHYGGVRSLIEASLTGRWEWGILAAAICFVKVTMQ